MSTETAEVVNYETCRENGFVICPRCGFEAPESLFVCWKCGKNLK
jgi:predicted RNA-binding Zn-ribbon protein involved in translation (DUF1610 family)